MTCHIIHPASKEIIVEPVPKHSNHHPQRWLQSDETRMSCYIRPRQRSGTPDSRKQRWQGAAVRSKQTGAEVGLHPEARWRDGGDADEQAARVDQQRRVCPDRARDGESLHSNGNDGQLRNSVKGKRKRVREHIAVM